MEVTLGARVQTPFNTSSVDSVPATDAFVRLNLHPALSVLAGNAHRPFGGIAQTNSAQMSPIG
jgi:hypothetical protein